MRPILRKELILAALAGTIVIMGLGIYSPTVRVAIADLSSEEIRGTSLGFFFTTRMISFFLSPNISGIMADRFGQGFPFLVGAGGLALGIWASLYLSPSLSKAEPGSLIHPVGPEQVEVRRKFL